jgi:hypothetical protein
MSRFDDWEPKLEHKTGGPARLLGIDIYHDFDWSDVVTRGMAQFSHGLRLSASVGFGVLQVGDQLGAGVDAELCVHLCQC